MHPFEEFIEAMEAARAGEKERASQLLAQSLGAEKPTTVMEDNLEAFFEPGPIAGVVFRVIQAEARRRERRPHGPV